MVNAVFGIFILLHGFVHLWYVVLSRGLVEFKPEMGWSGKSWAFSSIMSESLILKIAAISFGVAAISYLISAIGLLAQSNWSLTALLWSAVFSTLVIFIFWDGGTQLLVQKGLIGLLINLAIIMYIIFK